MPLSLPRTLLLFLCTAAAFVTLGRAPGAVSLKTRDIEAAIQGEGRSGRDKRSVATWQRGPAA
ncbi:hypothetical protein [Enterovirga sp.]|jgi:hypothetical protein|uniref:hypothetical protein n=1 Tax=Enterovirga sp. TaxID=2026350 RepID=UPI002601947A|nr:hypothetical protein [Enterovirga sp.]MDB5591718.1 hypothetical protein [Enterovirga sp.]